MKKSRKVSQCPVFQTMRLGIGTSDEENEVEQFTAISLGAAGGPGL
jgi:hypothetical protein